MSITTGRRAISGTMAATPCSARRSANVPSDGLGILGFDEVDAEAREIAGRGAALDLEGRHPQLEQASCQLVLDDRAGADVRVVDDQLVRRDARREAVAMLNRLQRLVTRHDGVDTERARRRIGVELTDRAGEQLQRALNRRQIGGAGVLRFGVVFSVDKLDLLSTDDGSTRHPVSKGTTAL